MNEFNITFPHVIKCVSSQKKNNPYLIYYKYIGNDKSLRKNSIYQFYYVMYKLNKETEYKEYLVSQNDSGKYVKYEENSKDWSSYI
mgnify:FL=1|tara:strand:- start:12150 stop:12407 length:258 start_codon:yes stop_codon:yes gene_type:complete